MPMFYGRNYVSIVAPFSGLRATIDWLSSVVKIRGPKPFKKFRLGLGPGPEERPYSTMVRSPKEGDILTDKFPCLWPLLLFFYQSGVEVDYDIQSKLGTFSKGDYRGYEPCGYKDPTLLAANDMRFCVTAIREMTELAVRARLAQRTKAEVRAVFEAWMVWRRAHPYTRAWLNVRNGELKWMWREDTTFVADDGRVVTRR